MAVGTFNTMWCKWVEVSKDREGGVGGPRCAKLAQMYADALDAKKHLIMPQASHEMKVGSAVHDSEVGPTVRLLPGQMQAGALLHLSIYCRPSLSQHLIP